MAAVKTQSVLAKKYGAKLDGAVKAHANDQTTYGLIALPGGITNGIAQVSKCYFKEFEKATTMKKADGTPAVGEYYFRCEGSVISPKTVAGPDGLIPVEGLTTSVMVPLCDTKDSKGVITSQEDNLARVLNIMRQLAGQEYTQGATGADLESLAAGIEQAAPYFRFSTTQSQPNKDYPNPRVFENWQGNKGLENYVPENVAATAMKDNTSTKPSGQKQQKVTEPQVPDNTVKAADNVYAEWELSQLVDLAGSEADTAQEGREELVRRAMEVGYTRDEAEAADTWEACAEMIQNPKSAEDEQGSDDTSSPEVEPEPEVTPPKTGTTCKYTPPGKDPATKKEYKERPCTIVKVDKDKKTVEIKDLSNKKMYTGIKWEDIS